MDWISTFLPMGSSSVKTLLQVLNIPFRQKKITHSPRQYFFKNLFPPTEERGGGNYDLLYQKLIRKYEDDDTTNTEDFHFGSFNSSLA